MFQEGFTVRVQGREGVRRRRRRRRRSSEWRNDREDARRDRKKE